MSATPWSHGRTGEAPLPNATGGDTPPCEALSRALVARDATAPASVLATTMPLATRDLHAASYPPAAVGAVLPSTPASPLDVVGGAVPQRFRDRVRARAGASDVLAFRVGAERFACDVRALDEAIDSPDVAPAPGARVVAFEGVVRLSGRSVPVFDAGALLGVTGGERRQMLLLRAGDERVGLLVDDVEDVVSLPLVSIQSPPVDGGDDLLLGVTWDGTVLTAVLDARALVVACQHRLRAGGVA
jgi:chemotaxis signal transduction protein